MRGRSLRLSFFLESLFSRLWWAILLKFQMLSCQWTKNSMMETTFPNSLVFLRSSTRVKAFKSKWKTKWKNSLITDGVMTKTNQSQRMQTETSSNNFQLKSNVLSTPTFYSKVSFKSLEGTSASQIIKTQIDTVTTPGLTSNTRNSWLKFFRIWNQSTTTKQRFSSRNWMTLTKLFSLSTGSTILVMKSISKFILKCDTLERLSLVGSKLALIKGASLFTRPSLHVVATLLERRTGEHLRVTILNFILPSRDRRFSTISTRLEDLC